jgi:uncharacterized membrane protein YoaK (UPF0700 family)
MSAWPVEAPANLRRPLSSLAQSAILAGSGGMLDAFTYVGHGHVFANSMTGNVVLLGVNAVAGGWHQSLRHLLPILSFLLGVSTAKAFRLPSVVDRIPNPDLAVMTLEIAMLAVLSFLPDATPDFWITINVAFAASVQTGTFHEVEGNPYNSTFTTGNLRNLSESLFAWLFQGRVPAAGRKVRVFSIICGCFLLGAMVGAFLTPLLHNKTLWLVCLLLGFVWMHLTIVHSVPPLRQGRGAVSDLAEP